MRKLNFDEAVVIALFERARRLNGKLSDRARKKAEEVIEKHNLSEEDIKRIYDWFTNPSLLKN